MSLVQISNSLSGPCSLVSTEQISFRHQIHGNTCKVIYEFHKGDGVAKDEENDLED